MHKIDAERATIDRAVDSMDDTANLIAFLKDSEIKNSEWAARTRGRSAPSITEPSHRTSA